MILYGWGAFLPDGTQCFGPTKRALQEGLAQQVHGIPLPKVFPLYRVATEFLQPVADATQPKEEDNGQRTS